MKPSAVCQFTAHTTNKYLQTRWGWVFMTVKTLGIHIKTKYPNLGTRILVYTNWK